jgi:ATP phosphoribosyltransferase
VKNGTAEAIADITTSGETLRANHLRVLSDGLIHSSEAVLWASQVAEWTGEDRAAMGRLAGMLGVRSPL